MKKFFLIAGPCAIEERDTAFTIANEVKRICDNFGITYIFKGSYEKPTEASSTALPELENNQLLKF